MAGKVGDPSMKEVVGGKRALERWEMSLDRKVQEKGEGRYCLGKEDRS